MPLMFPVNARPCSVATAAVTLGALVWFIAGKTATADEPSAPPSAISLVAPEPPAPIEYAKFVFAEAVLTVSESAGMVAITIHRVGPPTGRASAAWWVEEGSASENSDYGSLGIRLENFEEGETSREIYLPIVADSLSESPESFYVNLPGRSGPSAQSQGSARVRVTIVDDDN